MFCSLLMIPIMYILLSLASPSIIMELNSTFRIKFSYYRDHICGCFESRVGQYSYNLIMAKCLF